MTANGHRVPPGPKGLPLVGMAFTLRSDPLAGMRRIAREYGDIVRFHVMMQERILLNHPDWINQVLVIQHSKFHKSELTRRITARMLGQGLLISEGEFWRRQRRLAQPAFHRNRVNGYAATMLEIAQAHIHDWRDGEERNIAQEMTALTLDIAVRTLFGTTLPGESRQVGRAMTFLMRYSLRRQRLPFRIPENWPTPANRRANHELEFIDSLVYRIISERRAAGNSNHHSDLLALLMNAMDDDGSQMTPQQLHDETMTLFLAGHETTANALAWTWYLLSQNPEVERKLHAELADVLNGRLPTVADLPSLRYTSMVIDESMRLYPPAWSIGRSPVADDEILGFNVRAGCSVMLSQWLTHRHPDFWENPERFDPERFSPERSANRPHYAYFPFGGGPRQCIGNVFALTEANLILAAVAQKYRLRMVPGHRVALQPLITLRPRYGLKMRLEPVRA